MDLLPGDGVREREQVCVQEVATIAGKAGEDLKREAGHAVQRIAHQRMPDGRQMDPDLVRSTGVEADLEGGGAAGS